MVISIASANCQEIDLREIILVFHILAMSLWWTPYSEKKEPKQFIWGEGTTKLFSKLKKEFNKVFYIEK